MCVCVCFGVCVLECVCMLFKFKFCDSTFLRLLNVSTGKMHYKCPLLLLLLLLFLQITSERMPYCRHPFTGGKYLLGVCHYYFVERYVV